MSAHHGSSENPPTGKYELSDLPMRPVLISLVVMGVTVVLVFLGMYALGKGFMAYTDSTEPKLSPLAAASGPKEPPVPRLQNAPARDMADLRAWENRTLGSYAWVDKPAGQVRIPIDRAIDLLAARGLPSRPAGAGAP